MPVSSCKTGRFSPLPRVKNYERKNVIWLRISYWRFAGKWHWGPLAYFSIMLNPYYDAIKYSESLHSRPRSIAEPPS